MSKRAATAATEHKSSKKARVDKMAAANVRDFLRMARTESFENLKAHYGSLADDEATLITALQGKQDSFWPSEEDDSASEPESNEELSHTVSHEDSVGEDGDEKSKEY